MMDHAATNARPADILVRLAASVPGMQARAVALDRDESFPAVDVPLLHGLGLLTAPLPRAMGGQGAGTEPEGADLLLALLRTIGRGNLPVGRLFEAHVNAVKLIHDYGTPEQAGAAAADAQAGRMFGVWVTDAPGRELTWADGTLRGSKGPCSGAGYLSRALVTIATPAGTRLAVLHLDRGEVVRPLRGLLHGMRASMNGWIDFDGVPLAGDAVIGQAGDYLREPQLSTGAWRTMAVTLGGLEALVGMVGRQLRRKGHHGDALQQSRFGEMLIAEQTALLWTQAAAQCSEAGTAPVADRVAYVNLARIALEGACLDAMRLAQRSIGFGTYLTTNPMERVLRDLSVYLRQPAPDAVLTEAAQHRLQQL